MFRLRNIRSYLKTIILVIFLTACNSENVPSFKNTRTLQDAIHDFQQIKFNEGINDVEIEGSFSNVFWRFRIIIPVGASEKNTRPLIVCLHGGSSIIDKDIHKHTDCLEEPGLMNIAPILLCPNSEGFGWDGIPEQEKILSLTRLVTETLPVDVNKVAIMGYSDGGNGAWFYADHYPNSFSAAIAISSSYNTLNPNLLLKIDIPMYVIHGEIDELFPLEKTQNAANGAIEAGTNLEFVIADGLGHFNSCLYVPYLKEAANWLEMEVWN